MLVHLEDYTCRGEGSGLIIEWSYPQPPSRPVAYAVITWDICAQKKVQNVISLMTEKALMVVINGAANFRNGWDFLFNVIFLFHEKTNRHFFPSENSSPAGSELFRSTCPTFFLSIDIAKAVGLPKVERTGNVLHSLLLAAAEAETENGGRCVAAIEMEVGSPDVRRWPSWRGSAIRAHDEFALFSSG